jgi:hypothetical protein
MNQRIFALALAAAVALAFAQPAVAQDTPTPPTPPTPPTAPAAPAVEPYDPRDPTAVISRLPPDVRSRLEGHEIVNIVEAQNRSGLDEDIVIPTVFFGTIIGIVLMFVILRLRRDHKLHETLRAMIDKGVDIPPALLVPPVAKKNDRRTGIILAMAGVGTSGFLYMVDKSGSGAWALGFVPFFLGVGYLVAHVLDVRAAHGPSSVVRSDDAAAR